MMRFLGLIAFGAIIVAVPSLAQDVTPRAERIVQSIIGSNPGDGPRSLGEVTPTPGLNAETITDDQIDSFIEALAMISRVTAVWVPQIEAETDGAQRARFIDQANIDVVAAVDFIADITPQDYVAIDRATQSDEALNARVQTRIVELNNTGDGRVRTVTE